MSSDSTISTRAASRTKRRRRTLLDLPTELLLDIFSHLSLDYASLLHDIFSHLSSDYASLLFLPRTCRCIRHLTLPSPEHSLSVPTSSKLAFLLHIEKYYPRYLNTHFTCSYCTHILPRSAFGDCQVRIPPRVRDYERRGSMFCLECTSDVYPDIKTAPPRTECGRSEQVVCVYCRKTPGKKAFCDICKRCVPCASNLSARHSHKCWKCERWYYPHTRCTVARRPSWRQATVPVVYGYGVRDGKRKDGAADAGP